MALKRAKLVRQAMLFLYFWGRGRILILGDGGSTSTFGALRRVDLKTGSASEKVYLATVRNDLC